MSARAARTPVWGLSPRFQQSWGLPSARIRLAVCPEAGQSGAQECSHPQWGRRGHEGIGGKTTSPKGAPPRCRYPRCRSSPHRCRPCSPHRRRSASAWGCSARSCTGTGRTRSGVCSLSAGDGRGTAVSRDSPGRGSHPPRSQDQALSPCGGGEHAHTVGTCPHACSWAG